jgi:CRP/FNR family transcriptional regulator, cyclic AMP receptor protein
VLGGGLGPDDLHALVDAGRVVEARPRQQVLRAGDDRAVLVIRGTAKVHASSVSGGEVITALVGPGFSAGLQGVLGRLPGTGDVTSLEPLQALTIGGPDLRRLVTSRPEIAAACLRTLATRLVEADADRARFAGTSITQRVALRLLELANLRGRAEGEAIRVTVPLTQDELAAWSGASRESVAKVLHRMRATGLVATGRRSLTSLDPGRLRERCEQPEPDAADLLLSWPQEPVSAASRRRDGHGDGARHGRQRTPAAR